MNSKWISYLDIMGSILKPLWENIQETTPIVKVLVPKKKATWLGWQTHKINGFGAGYDHFQLRSGRTSEKMNSFLDACYHLGILNSTSGGKRNVKVKANSNQSSVSSHTLGRAFDLWVYGGGFWSEVRYVVTKHPGKRFSTVWALSTSEQVPEISVQSFDHRKQKHKAVIGRYVNLTELLLEYGFDPIPQRKSYPKNYGSWEWWHFQDNEGLIVGETTYGSELLLVWTKKQLKGTPAWARRNYVWNGKTFVKKRK